MVDCDGNISWSETEDSVLEEQHSIRKLDNRRCTYCFKILKSSSYIANHIKICKVALKSSARTTCRNGSQKFVCDICCRTFKHLRFLAEHEKRHKPPGDFLCKYCDKKFCTELEREKHTEDTHKVFKCQICKEIFETAENYIEHIKILHNGQNREYKACNDCGRLFSSPLILKYHQDTNCGLNGKFKCDQCDKTFQTKGRLKIHKLTHSGEKNFCCSYCGQKFRHFMHLQSHEFKHTGKKPYQCNVCQKSFSHRASLSTHSTTHTGLKPYLCECCGSRFSCASNIIQHRKKRPDTCGLPQYCTKLAKACPIANLKNPSLLTAEAPIKIFKTTKVIKENEVEPENQKKGNHVKKSGKNKNINCYKCTDQVFKQKFRYVKHLRDYHKKCDEEINELLETNLKCNICGKLYTLVKNLEKHIYSHHKITDNNNIITKPDTTLDNNFVFESISQIPNKSSFVDEPECRLHIKTEIIPKLASNITIKINQNSIKLNEVKMENEENLANFVNNNEDDNKMQIYTNKCLNSEKTLATLNDPLQNSFSEDEKIRNNLPNDRFFKFSKISRKNKTIIRCYKCVDEIFYFKSVYIRHLRSRHHNKSSEEIEKILEELKKNQLKDNKSNQHEEVNHGEKESEKDEILEPLIKTNQKSIRCSECKNQYFSQKSGYIRHLRGRIHSKSEEEIEKLIQNLSGRKPNLKCNICGKLYTIHFYLQKHLEAHDNPKEENTLDKSQYSQLNQTNSIEGKKIIRCYKCTDQVFTQKCLYIRHLRGRHHNKSEQEIEKLLQVNLKCKICGKIYSIPYYLKRHLKTHGIEATHKCKLCDEYFLTPIEVLTHTQSEHEDQLKCSICVKTFSDLDSLVRHNQFVHSNKEKKQFICIKCGKKTSSKISLNDHELSNCGKNPIYRCDVCGKGLSTAGILKAHMMLHTNDFPYKCSYCDKGFRFNDKLKVHLRSHTGEKPFKCPYCNKAFGHSSTLYIHVSTHTGIKRYMCTTCSDRFSCISGLKAHWKTHPTTCGADPNRTTKPQVFMGYRKGKLVNKKDIID